MSPRQRVAGRFVAECRMRFFKKTLTFSAADLVNFLGCRHSTYPVPGNEQRAGMPHPEIFAVLTAGSELLLDDGRLRLVVERCGPTFAETASSLHGHGVCVSTA